jgi:hypothetical protein
VPGIISLELGTEHRQHTADYLTQLQIPFEEMPEGTLAVPAREANGAILFFS